jgi:hypothetical protein
MSFLLTNSGGGGGVAIELKCHKYNRYSLWKHKDMRGTHTLAELVATAAQRTLKRRLAATALVLGGAVVLYVSERATCVQMVSLYTVYHHAF